jgi:serine/threonine-protein kinase HipA
MLRDPVISPDLYLSSASAALLATTPDARVFISGCRNRWTRLRGLEMVPNAALSSPVAAVIGDDLAETRAGVSSLRQRILEACRLRSEHISAITAEMREQMAPPLVGEHGVSPLALGVDGAARTV